MARAEYFIEYTAERNRVTALFRVILAIPHLIIENIGSQLAQVLGFFQWWVILFTGARNEQLWKAQNVWLGYAARVYGYQSLMFDKWPNIGVGPNGEPTSYSFQYEKSARRLSNFFRLIWVIPAAIVAIFVLLMAVVVTLLSWLIILFTGKHPRGMFDAVLKVHRYMVHLNSYVLLMTDDYPKYGS